MAFATLATLAKQSTHKMKQITTVSPIAHLAPKDMPCGGGIILRETSKLLGTSTSVKSVFSEVEGEDGEVVGVVEGVEGDDAWEVVMEVRDALSVTDTLGSSSDLQTNHKLVML